METITSFSGEHRFLSNFYPAKVTYEGTKFDSVENAYVAAKTLFATEGKSHFPEIASMTPGQAKRFGRLEIFAKINGDPLWEVGKITIMSKLVHEKFTSNEDLKELLLATGHCNIIEGNTWGDRFWGQSPIGNGKNMLGRIIMSVRHYLIIEKNGFLS